MSWSPPARVSDVTTIAELTLDEEISPLKKIAARWGWRFERRDDLSFVLGMQARDSSWFWLMCRCDRYPSMPPAWHWYNPETDETDNVRDTPAADSRFFHGNGVICAPWNRLAYGSVDTRGPHNDWQIGDWKSNPKTGACTRIAAMALRISTELRNKMFKGRIA